MMHQLRYMLRVAACLLVGLVWTQGWANTSPVPMLENAASEIINTLKSNKAALKNNPTIIEQAVRHHLLPHVDVVGMSRSVLGRQAWMHATAAQKEQFTAAFTRLVIHTYATPLTNYTDEKVTFSPIRGDLSKRFSRVQSVVTRSTGRPIAINYSLVAKGDGWKIYDLSVEGVSLLQSFRSQCAQALQRGDINSLIAEMNKRSNA